MLQDALRTRLSLPLLIIRCVGLLSQGPTAGSGAGRGGGRGIRMAHLAVLSSTQTSLGSGFPQRASGRQCGLACLLTSDHRLLGVALSGPSSQSLLSDGPVDENLTAPSKLLRLSPEASAQAVQAYLGAS